MLRSLQKETDNRMQKSIEALTHALAKVRTGRAHPSVLNGVRVEYYGNFTPLNQLASISVLDSRTLQVTPFDKNSVQAIDKAIRTSELGLNPATAGQIIRVPLPPLTEERRKELVKQVRMEAENSKVSIRNIRREANNDVKELLKEKEISEDEEKKAEEEIQKLTDKFILKVDEAIAVKEKELMQV